MQVLPLLGEGSIQLLVPHHVHLALIVEAVAPLQQHVPAVDPLQGLQACAVHDYLKLHLIRWSMEESQPDPVLGGSLCSCEVCSLPLSQPSALDYVQLPNVGDQLQVLVVVLWPGPQAEQVLPAVLDL